jgi:hypothetical protein
MANGGAGRGDPYWVDVEEDDLLMVAMTPSAAIAYQTWLRSQGLYVLPIPKGEGEGEQVWTVGVRDGHHGFPARSGE